MSTFKYFISAYTHTTNSENEIIARIELDSQIENNIISFSYNYPHINLKFEHNLTKNEQDIIQLIMDMYFYGNTVNQNNYQTIKPRSIVVHNNIIPTKKHDINLGYNTGSTIFNNMTKTLYTCVEPSANNSIWFSTNNTCYVSRYSSNGTIVITPAEKKIDLTNIEYANGIWELSNGGIVIGATGTYDISYSISVKFGSIGNKSLATMISTILKVDSNYVSNSQKTIQRLNDGSTIDIITHRCVAFFNTGNILYAYVTASNNGSEIPNNLGQFPVPISNIASIIIKQI